MRFHFRPLGIGQHISVHPKLESQYLAQGNPKSQQTLSRLELAHPYRPHAAPRLPKIMSHLQSKPSFRTPRRRHRRPRSGTSRASIPNHKPFF
jgi:hypothetical protein